MIGIRNYDEPGYTVLLEQDGVQIRQYPPVLLAETLVQADYKASGSIGFKRLAGYIFGNNIKRQNMPMTTPVYREAASEDISMTAPVLQQPQGGQWLMSFVMPAQYTLATLPEPIDKTITLREVPAKKVAVLRYSGSLDQEAITAHSQTLTAWLQAHHYTALSPARSAAFDPPWTIPMLRRNEIHIDIQ